jgi:translation initiation factor IF-3
MDTSKALELSLEQGLDLIEVAAKAAPPVVRIMDYGKYQYQKEKEARQSAKKQKEIEIKGVRIGLNTSIHDMELKARAAEEFLAESNKVRVEFILRGRAKYLDRNFIQGRLDTFLKLITTPYKVTAPALKGPRGLNMTIEKE